MFHDNTTSQLGRFEFGIVRKKVRQIIGRAGFMAQDREDLEHELFARLLQSLKCFDPNQSHRNVFVTAVVERDVANILRDKKAEKRNHRRISSLNVMVNITDEGPTELAQTIGQHELDVRRGRHPRSDEDLAQLVSDLADVMAKLPEELRDLAERRKTQTVSEIAREMEMPRTTLNESFRRLRRHGKSAGLKDYL
jgi:RNA polymerase sigma factor (sigma-70 family)